MLKNFSYQQYKLQKGSSSSGNFDHAGRPGLVGGSAPPEEYYVSAIPETASTPIENPGSAAVQKTLDRLSDDMKDLSKEIMYVVDLDGTIIKKLQGNEDSVHLPKHFYAEDKFVIHNHPDGEPLSPADFGVFLLYKIREIHAVGPLGIWKFATDISKSKSLNRNQYRKLVDDMTDIYESTYDKQKDKSLSEDIPYLEAIHIATKKSIEAIEEKYPGMLQSWWEPQRNPSIKEPKLEKLPPKPKLSGMELFQQYRQTHEKQ